MSKSVEQNIDARQAWIIVADRSNMTRVANSGVFGLNTRGPLPRVKIGDFLVAYIRGEKAFSGLGRVTQEHFTDKNPIFDRGVFPERIGVKLDLLPATESKDIWWFLDDLKFPSDKARWSASLIGGIRQIPLEDYQLFAAQLDRNAKNDT